ncbi:hypothetical protein ACFWXO_43240 [Kitasatospora sp. NPDC059088]|uniref:hypothetical protein n=1 Tax=Kitasatospora sp. NPDC059088 TaxID=3346722 RepID=UPI0036A9C826
MFKIRTALRSAAQRLRRRYEATTDAQIVWWAYRGVVIGPRWTVVLDTPEDPLYGPIMSYQVARTAGQAVDMAIHEVTRRHRHYVARLQELTDEELWDAGFASHVVTFRGWHPVAPVHRSVDA